MSNKVLKIGVIGGQGPIASAIFVESIYHRYVQSSIDLSISIPPKVYLISDPLNKPGGQILTVDQCNTLLLTALKENIRYLELLSPDFIVICCLSAHALLPQLSIENRRSILSLVDILIQEMIIRKKSYVLFSASTERQLKILERHEKWDMIANQISFVSKKEQAEIDHVICDVKNGMLHQAVYARFEPILMHYPHHEIILGCSELHVIHRKLMQDSSSQTQFAIFDPFLKVIETILQPLFIHKNGLEDVA